MYVTNQRHLKMSKETHYSAGEIVSKPPQRSFYSSRSRFFMFAHATQIYHQKFVYHGQKVFWEVLHNAVTRVAKESFCFNMSTTKQLMNTVYEWKLWY